MAVLVHVESVPIRKRADIGKIRNGVTDCSPDGKLGCAALYLGGIADLVWRAWSTRRVILALDGLQPDVSDTPMLDIVHRQQREGVPHIAIA